MVRNIGRDSLQGYADPAPRSHAKASSVSASCQLRTPEDAIETTRAHPLDGTASCLRTTLRLKDQGLAPAVALERNAETAWVRGAVLGHGCPTIGLPLGDVVGPSSGIHAAHLPCRMAVRSPWTGCAVIASNPDLSPPVPSTGSSVKVSVRTSRRLTPIPRYLSQAFFVGGKQFD